MRGKVLVDTHTLVWALSDSSRLSEVARAAVTSSEVVVSVAILWELLLKKGKTDCLLADPLPWWNRYVIRSGIPVLSIRNTHVATLDALPEIHKDPFDRILLAQAIVEKTPFVTKDSSLAAYGVRLIW